jgi:hypothetical protein
MLPGRLPPSGERWLRESGYGRTVATGEWVRESVGVELQRRERRRVQVHT